MQEINVYLYKINSNEILDVDNFFSSYRIKQIESSSNKSVIERLKSTEYLLKKVLEIETNKDINTIKIQTSKFGKPYLKNINKYYNISHKDEYILIGISDFELGLDIERIDPKYLKLAKKIYESNNNYSINKVIKDFTIKESYIKYYGLSILFDLKAIKSNDNHIFGPIGTLNYSVFNYGNYYISIASNNDIKVNFYSLNNLFSKDLTNLNKYIRMIKSDDEE